MMQTGEYLGQVVVSQPMIFCLTGVLTERIADQHMMQYVVPTPPIDRRFLRSCSDFKGIDATLLVDWMDASSRGRGIPAELMVGVNGEVGSIEYNVRRAGRTRVRSRE